MCSVLLVSCKRTKKDDETTVSALKIHFLLYFFFISRIYSTTNILRPIKNGQIIAIKSLWVHVLIASGLKKIFHVIISLSRRGGIANLYICVNQKQQMSNWKPLQSWQTPVDFVVLRTVQWAPSKWNCSVTSIHPHNLLERNSWSLSIYMHGPTAINA